MNPVEGTYTFIRDHVANVSVSPASGFDHWEGANIHNPMMVIELTASKSLTAGDGPAPGASAGWKVHQGHPPRFNGQGNRQRAGLSRWMRRKAVATFAPPHGDMPPPWCDRANTGRVSSSRELPASTFSCGGTSLGHHGRGPIRHGALYPGREEHGEQGGPGLCVAGHGDHTSPPANLRPRGGTRTFTARSETTSGSGFVLLGVGFRPQGTQTSVARLRWHPALALRDFVHFS